MRSIVWMAMISALGLAAACATDADRSEAPPGETRPSGDRVPDDADMLAIETLYRSSRSGVEDSRRVVIRSDSAWQRFWGELHAGQRTPPERPQIDFDRSIVVGATAGEKPTGGHSIAIEGVLANDDGVWVSVVKTEPGEGCLRTQALTYPAVAVEAPKRDGPVKIIDRSVTEDC